MKIYQKLICSSICTILSLIAEMNAFPAQAATFSVSGTTGDNKISFNGAFDYNASNSKITGGTIDALNIYRTSVKNLFSPSVLAIGLLLSDINPATDREYSYVGPAYPYPAKYIVQDYLYFHLPTDIDSFLTGGGGSCLSSCGGIVQTMISSSGTEININSYNIAGPKLSTAVIPEPSNIGGTFFLAFLGLGWLFNKKISS